jgi:hypothetical protein
MKIKRKCLIILVVTLLGGAIFLSLFMHVYEFKEGLVLEIRSKQLVPAILGEIENERYTIIDAIPYLRTSPEVSILSLVDESKGTRFFIWRKWFSSILFLDYYFNLIFSELTIDNLLSFLNENHKWTKNIFGSKDLRRMVNMKLLERGVFLSEYGLKIPYIETTYQIDKRRVLLFAANFIYIEGMSLYETTFVAINEEDRYDDQEIQEMINRILSHKERGDPSIEEKIDSAIKDLEKGDLKVRKEAILSLREIGSERTLDILIPLLKDKNKEIREEAACALGGFRDKRAVDALCAALKDGEKEVRRRAIFSLMEINSVYSVDFLIDALGDEDVNVRSMAVHALTRLGDKRAVEPFISLLKRDKNKAIRLSIVGGLGLIGDKRAIGPLISALKDENNIVRRHAVISLGMIGDKHVIPKLEELLKDEDEAVRKEAKRAIEEIIAKNRKVLN